MGEEMFFFSRTLTVDPTESREDTADELKERVEMARCELQLAEAKATVAACSLELNRRRIEEQKQYIAQLEQDLSKLTS